MSDSPGSRRPLAIMRSDTGRALGVFGVLACTLCCLSVPGIAAALAASGLSFLRNDRILLPGTILFAAVAIGTLVRARARHGRWLPLVVAIAAIAMVWTGLTAFGGALLVTVGDLALLGAVVWDSRLHRRCAT